MLNDLMVSMRPQQWIKNSFLFAALIFAEQLMNPEKVVLALAGFLLFSLLSSSVYLLNDVKDAEADRQHPIKKSRPVAAGRISAYVALGLSIVLMGTSLTLSYLIAPRFWMIACGYVVLNLFYSMWLKRVAVVDVMCIAAGFVLRAAAGGAVIDVAVSSWLIICTFFLALFLGLAKRRHELVLLEGNSSLHRENLAEYSPYLLDQMILMVMTGTLVCYILYTLSDEVQQKLDAPHLYLTIPFVLYGIYRYLYLIHRKEGGGNPSATLLSDRPLLLNVFLWVVVSALMLYF